MVGSGQVRVRVVEFGTGPTRLSLVGSDRVVSKFHYTDPRTLSATRPDQTLRQSPYMSMSMSMWSLR